MTFDAKTLIERIVELELAEKIRSKTFKINDFKKLDSIPEMVKYAENNGLKNFSSHVVKIEQRYC
jgi:hypothetical protein